ncbi:uncharacterized protein LOC123685330 [Harmonia axyridis]|uniref:uncharacterized protein LOC123685330 n=1 Tax=Harmonia axyridis TaxID=115357 RepID=UPI001E2786EB|nr:uncharacterized protein LOC123685330 [Harmonia axyridis]
MNANSERIEISRNLLEKAEKARSVLLPTKSELKYKKEYDKFLQWMEVNRMDSKNTSETVMLAYFQEMSELYSPNSLWTKWSMLKLMMRIHDDIDGSKFHELEAFLKRKSKGYEPKKSQVFSREDIVKYDNIEETWWMAKFNGGRRVFGRQHGIEKQNCKDVSWHVR